MKTFLLLVVVVGFACFLMSVLSSIDRRQPQVAFSTTVAHPGPIEKTRSQQNEGKDLLALIDDTVPVALRSDGPPTESQPVIAKGVNAAPGAIICPDLRTVSVMFDQYAQSQEDKFNEALTHGQSSLVRGPAAKPPNLRAFDCVLIEPGTPMMLELNNMVPVVRLRTGGRWVRGVTLDAMFSRAPSTSKDDSAQSETVLLHSKFQMLKPAFKSQFESLERPAPNLRFFEPLGQTLLVTPFGPCIVIRRDNRSYLLIEVETNKQEGPYESEQTARQVAVAKCSQRYYALRAATDSSMNVAYWFPPEAPNEP